MPRRLTSRSTRHATAHGLLGALQVGTSVWALVGNWVTKCSFRDEFRPGDFLTPGRTCPGNRCLGSARLFCERPKIPSGEVVKLQGAVTRKPLHREGWLRQLAGAMTRKPLHRAPPVATQQPSGKNPNDHPELQVLEVRGSAWPKPSPSAWPEPGEMQQRKNPLRPVPLLGPKPEDLQAQGELRPGLKHGPQPREEQQADKGLPGQQVKDDRCPNRPKPG